MALYDLPGIGPFLAARDRSLANDSQQMRDMFVASNLQEQMLQNRRRSQIEQMAALAGGDPDRLIQGYMQLGDAAGATQVASAVETQRKLRDQATARQALLEYYGRPEQAGPGPAPVRQDALNLSPVPMGPGVAPRAPAQPTEAQPGLSRGSAIEGEVRRLMSVAGIMASKGLIDQATAYRDQATKLMAQLPKYQAATRVIQGPDGRPRLALINDAGELADSGVAPMEKLHFGDTGQRTGIGMDPYTGAQTTAGLQRYMTPGEGATDARARQRLAFDQAQAAKPTVVSVEGVGPYVVNRDTGTGRRVTDATGAPITPVSTDDRKDVRAFDVQSRILRAGIEAARANPKAFSMERGLATEVGSVAESARGRLDTEDERQARSFIFNTVSAVVKERAGTAQSAQELRRINSFLPANTDTADQIIDKLEAYERYIAESRGAYPNAGAPAPAKPRIDPATKRPTMGEDAYLNQTRQKR